MTRTTIDPWVVPSHDGIEWVARDRLSPARFRIIAGLIRSGDVSVVGWSGPLPVVDVLRAHTAEANALLAQALVGEVADEVAS